MFALLVIKHRLEEGDRQLEGVGVKIVRGLLKFVPFIRGKGRVRPVVYMGRKVKMELLLEDY